VAYEVFHRLGGTEGILTKFFHEFLDEQSDADRLDVLELLEPLITSRGTRNIAEWNTLVEAPFRSRARREELLELMKSRTIIRVEQRPTGRLVEITHEFLIPPIQQALTKERTRSSSNARFREAVLVLEGYERTDFRANPDRVMSLDELTNLHQNRERIVWTAWAVELMLRSAIVHEQRALIAEWGQRFEREVHAGRVDGGAAGLLAADRGGRTFSLDELRAINAARDSLRAPLTHEQVALILRSELLRASDAESDDVTYWTRKLAAAHVD
jgi:hypothetical protein